MSKTVPLWGISPSFSRSNVPAHNAKNVTIPTAGATRKSTAQYHQRRRGSRESACLHTGTRSGGVGGAGARGGGVGVGMLKAGRLKPSLAA